MEPARRRPASPLARGGRGMVASPHPLASLAGIDALRAGGNAVDAAIAANAVLAVVYNHACGLGGDAFALVWSPTESRLFGFNGSGRAPAQATAELLRSRGMDEVPERGPFSITVPGAVDAWSELITRFGRRTLADALLPAADLAERGHVVTDRSAAAISASETLLHGDPNAAATFLPNGRPPPAGALLRQPMLGRTLRLLALEGRDAFYRGPVARQIVQAIGDAGGVMSLDDLAAHAGEWVEPVATIYRDVGVHTIPPNSQGVTALIALNVLGALRELGWRDVPGDGVLGAHDVPNAARIHAQVEASKIAWAERDRLLGDPDRHPFDAGVLSPEHARELAGRLDPDQARIFEPEAIHAGGTVYLTAADSEGWTVSLIESNYMGFGAGIMAGTSGVMLQNRGASFTLAAGHPNRLEPRARPLHTLMPCMLMRRDRPWAAFGAMGGDGQPHTALQLVNALVDDGLNPQEAVDRPRWVLRTRARYGPLAALVVEADGVTPELVEELRARGHDVTVTSPRDAVMGWAQVTRHEPAGGNQTTLSGGADPRADSVALGW